MMAAGDEPGRDPDLAGTPAGATRLRALVLLRITLIVATAYLLVAELGPGAVPWFIVLLLGAVLASTALVPLLPHRVLESQRFLAVVILGDTAWITIALVVSGRFSADFFYLYFFVLFLAGIGENLRLIALDAVVVSAAYLVVIAAAGGAARVLSPGALLRVPFLFAVAIFYGYLVDRLRSEQRRARDEAEQSRRHAEHRRILAEANRALGAEIAERRRVEEQLQEANAELQAVAEMRSSFVSMVTHELRTPLTAMSNAASLLARSDALEAEPERRLVELASRNVERMKLLVSDLLDLSKAEAGRLRIEPEPFELGAALGNVAAAFASHATSAGVELVVVSPPTEVAVLADPRRLEQVLSNLVSNAVKACAARGHVELAARRLEDSVEIAVVDDGVGIAPEELARVFEPFYQGGGDLERRRQGTGLGLAISRDLVRAHGGELTLQSTLHQGSRFSFEVPLDGPRGRERLELEAAVRRFREHPYFSLVVVVPQDVDEDPTTTAARLEAIRDGLASLLPRTSDRLIVQPAHRRVLLAMLSTPAAGGAVVRRRLEHELATAPLRTADGTVVAVDLRGPSTYPEDGRFGRQLVERALARVTVSEEA